MVFDKNNLQVQDVDSYHMQNLWCFIYPSVNYLLSSTNWPIRYPIAELTEGLKNLKRDSVSPLAFFPTRPPP